jgi:drug/metabolite transporter (DMT)-like permease
MAVRSSNSLEIQPGSGDLRVPAAESGRARSSFIGVACIVASALCFGSMAIFGRVAYASGVDTTTLLMLRFSLAAVVMWAVFAIRRPALPRGKSLSILLAMGTIGYAGQAFCYFTAISLASAGLVALLLYLFPALVALLSWAVLRHRLTRAQVAAVATALAGSVLTVGDIGQGSFLGVVFAILAAFIYSVYILAGSRLPREVTPTVSAAVVTSAAAVVYLAIAAVRGVRFPATVTGWAAVLAIALICTVMAIGLFFAGLERVGPVRASVYSTVEPVCTVALAAVVLGEAVTVLRVLGGALILGAVLLLAREGATAPVESTA